MLLLQGDSNYDTWIFTLIVLLSSILVYNSTGVIDNDTLEKLQYLFIVRLPDKSSWFNPFCSYHESEADNGTIRNGSLNTPRANFNDMLSRNRGVCAQWQDHETLTRSTRWMAFQHLEVSAVQHLEVSKCLYMIAH